VFETTDVTIAELLAAGIQSLEQLRDLGFSEQLHLTRPYRKRLPVYMLVDKYGLSWDNGLKRVSPRSFRAFKLTAPELRLLDCDMQKFVMAGWKAKDVLALSISPSRLVRYLNMQLVHLNSLGLSIDVFVKNPLWKKDFEDQQSDFNRLIRK